MKISRNIVWNTAGSILPVVAGVVVVPEIIRHLGVERFGILSGIWMLIGYFSIFDFGLGRTLTKSVADRISAGRHDDIPAVVSTTVITVAGSGVVIGIMLLLLGDIIATRVAAGSLQLVEETKNAIVWLALSMPFVLIATALSGLLEALQKFAVLSAVRAPMGILIYLVPLLIIPYSVNIGVITAGLLLLRIINVVVLLHVSVKSVDGLRGGLFKFHRGLIKELLAFGGWLTMSNLVGPVMVYFDRFLVAGFLGSAAIAYYTVPYDVLTRLWILPSGIQAVLFPALIILRNQDFPRLSTVFVRSSNTTLLLLVPALFAVCCFSHEGFAWWVGPSFSENSSVVAVILMVGVLFNAMARTPFVFVQSAGYASWAAIVHMIELPLYAAGLWFSLKLYGIEGAAYAWSLRMALDAVIFYVLSARVEPRLRRIATRDIFLSFVLCVVAVVAGTIGAGIWLRGFVVAIACAVCGITLLGYIKNAMLPASSIPNPASITK